MVRRKKSEEIARPPTPSSTPKAPFPLYVSDEEELSVIKCICGFSEDDGNTVLCEKCDTWQHIACYYASAQHVPDAHDCRDCAPRYLDSRGAKRRQQKRRESKRAKKRLQGSRESIRQRIILEHYQMRPNIYKRKISPDPSSEGEWGSDSDAVTQGEEPMRNLNGKLICGRAECAELSFEGMALWRKHMNKHDLRFKCNVKGCEKLQGFAFSGLLLRHEREVHKMHGGLVTYLFCPFIDCERSLDSGFAREEDLAEHIRFEHRRTSLSDDMGGLIIRRETLSTMAGASKSPHTRAADCRQPETPKRLKYTISTDCTVSEVARNRMRFMALESGPKHKLTKPGS